MNTKYHSYVGIHHAASTAPDPTEAQACSTYNFLILGLLRLQVLLPGWPDLRNLLTTHGDGLGRHFCYSHSTGEKSEAEKPKRPGQGHRIG